MRFSTAILLTVPFLVSSASLIMADPFFKDEPKSAGTTMVDDNNILLGLVLTGVASVGTLFV
ncbi:hypothetical protein BDC45DRAFT_494807 [Circinella umbellata]|nr:hypothetical protein BDC45DRAFT_494807 [Circinella umbellata]